jgi:hypothetical protein
MTPQKNESAGVGFFCKVPMQLVKLNQVLATENLINRLKY